MKLVRVLTALLLTAAWFDAPHAYAQAGPGSPPVPYTETELRSPSPSPGDLFGTGVSLSDDGTRALVRSISGVSVFVRSGLAWTLEATLPGTTGEVTDPIALSGDGMVALVADTRAVCLGFGLCGLVQVYVRNGSVWTFAQNILPPSLFDFDFNFGNALALSADGSTVLVGRKFTGCGLCPGAAYVYTRNGSGVWMFDEGITAPEPGGEQFGLSVALTPDGQTALISSIFKSCPGGGQCGVAYVLRQSGGTWVSQGRLTPSQNVGPLAVALSATGGTALLGGVETAEIRGAVFVFELVGGVWTERIGFPGAMSGDRLGSSVDLSANGRIGIVSAPGRDCSAGLDCGIFHWVWRDAGGVWHLTDANPLAYPWTGPLANIPVALAADARTALVGIPQAPCVGGGDNCGLVLVLTAAALAAEIPTLGDFGRILLVLLLAGGGTWILARRRLFTSRSMAE
ncbi:MAG TPA: hypothetical protein VF789_15255 [Thermoanaerobaculia bacterium]